MLSFSLVLKLVYHYQWREDDRLNTRTQKLTAVALQYLFTIYFYVEENTY